MFDLGASEVILVLAIALLVIRPDQLSRTIRTVTLWISEFKRYFSTAKSNLEKEIGLDEIQSELRKETIVSQFQETAAQLGTLDGEIEQANVDLLDSFTFSEEKQPSPNKSNQA